MAASTVSSISCDELGRNFPTGSKFGDDYIKATEFDIGSGTPALAAHGVSGKFQYVIVIPFANNDEVEYVYKLKQDVDVRERLYFAFDVISAGAAKATTLTITYDAKAPGEVTAAGATALDGTIPAKTCTTANYLYETYYGWIEGSTLSAGDRLHITVKSTSNTTADNVKLVGMSIVWHSKFRNG